MSEQENLENTPGPGQPEPTHEAEQAISAREDLEQTDEAEQAESSRRDPGR